MRCWSQSILRANPCADDEKIRNPTTKRQTAGGKVLMVGGARNDAPEVLFGRSPMLQSLTYESALTAVRIAVIGAGREH